ncbi:conserved exported hypothetical protein [Bradyrhizobium sp. STM 3843]|uniref:hypothetical protein n=1 Tax=Bradyrhizobium sp. STM 3843 TaxID=551947 RepID=UPI0002404621|nr:hypothetical protein [Bradyrhizobium sp. STM 3843]CCE07988.1 conserved exported hypothetical protein [Bradyrhizobium sp. STM 3843]
MTRIAPGGTASPHFRPRSTWQVFRAPLAVGLAAAAGLTFALFGDGVWDAVSWVALSIPVVLSLIYGLRAAGGR